MPRGELPKLARRIGLFDATMIVMGGIIGTGIFINPYVVAQHLQHPLLIHGAWAAGGLIALAGAFIYAELATLRPDVGGQYAYIREAMHPSVAFIYGWTLLLVVQSGGMAAVAITFARYFLDLTHLPIADWAVAAIALGALTLINCLGVRSGSSVQSALMVLKIVAIAALIVCGLTVDSEWAVLSGRRSASAVPRPPIDGSIIASFGAAMVPVLFAYGGWQNSGFVAGEMREPRRDLPRGLLIGVAGVIVLYLLVNFVCLHALGPDGLARASTPASEVMWLALGEKGRRFIAVGIAISTFGFLSGGMLTAPRVYFAMARDGLFFRGISWLHPRVKVPVVAIALQGALAVVIAMSGKYEQILNYVVSVDSLFFGLTAACLFSLRKRAVVKPTEGRSYALKVNPVIIIMFIAAEWLVAASAIYKDPGNSGIGLGILLAGIPVYIFWRWRRAHD
jgi:APA family basic amino acid/polyamine antiporter